MKQKRFYKHRSFQFFLKKLLKIDSNYQKEIRYMTTEKPP